MGTRICVLLTVKFIMLPTLQLIDCVALCAQFEWRNGWFYALSTAALAAGRQNPCPRHTGLLKELGTVA